ncbi:isochorismatase family protein [Candidatus Woesearchaeota archaeon]|nr:isochorismatase family protein [Candidatus Woesearchaeota archaeon]
MTDLGNIAILVLDVQNDLCHENGLLARELGRGVWPVQEMVGRLDAFLQEARAYGVPIIYSKQIESSEVSPANLIEQFAEGSVKSAFSTSVFTSGSMENAGLKKIGPSEARMPPVY